jgi:hypothetical protein
MAIFIVDELTPGGMLILIFESFLNLDFNFRDGDIYTMNLPGGMPILIFGSFLYLDFNFRDGGASQPSL